MSCLMFLFSAPMALICFLTATYDASAQELRWLREGIHEGFREDLRNERQVPKKREVSQRESLDSAYEPVFEKRREEVRAPLRRAQFYAQLENRDEFTADELGAQLDVRWDIGSAREAYVRFQPRWAAADIGDLREDRSTPLFDDSGSMRFRATEGLGYVYDRKDRFLGWNGIETEAYVEIDACQDFNSPTGVDFCQRYTARSGVRVGDYLDVSAGVFYQENEFDPNFVRRLQPQTGLTRREHSAGGICQVLVETPEIVKGLRLQFAGDFLSEDFDKLNQRDSRIGFAFQVEEDCDVVLSFGENDLEGLGEGRYVRLEFMVTPGRSARQKQVSFGRR